MISHTVTIELPDPIYQKFVERSQQTKRPLEEELITAFAIEYPVLNFDEAANLKAYDEVMDFLASGPSPDQILQFRLSEEAQQRASELLQKNREQNLIDAEMQELDFYIELGDFLGILRAKTQLLQQSRLQ